MFRLLSEERPPKPETVVIAECPRVREREEGEKVHLRDFEDEANPKCVVCGQPAGVWFSYSPVDEWGPDVPPSKWMMPPSGPRGKSRQRARA